MSSMLSPRNHMASTSAILPWLEKSLGSLRSKGGKMDSACDGQRAKFGGTCGIANTARIMF